MPTIEIPSWLVQEAPGAADALRARADKPRLMMDSRIEVAEALLLSSHENADDEGHRDRLRRLVSDAAEPAWRDTGLYSTRKWRLSEDALYTAQFILAETAYFAPDVAPIGHLEIERTYTWFAETRRLVGELADRFREAPKYDHLFEAEWLLYGDRPAGERSIVDSLRRIADFLDRRAAHPDIRPHGPRIPVVQQPQSEDAHKRTVIIRIGRVCREHFRAPMYQTVTVLAELALNCGFKQDTVREILRSAGVV